MSEMALTADHVIVVGQGRLLRDQSMAEFIADASTDVVRVRSPQAARAGRDARGRRRDGHAAWPRACWR